MRSSIEASHSERLLPRWWAWLLAFGLVSMVAIAYGAALGATVGWSIEAGGVALVLLLLWVTAPRVTVTEEVLVVDRAQLPRTSVGSAAVVDAARIRELRGPGADARLFVALRPWSTPNGVLVELIDSEDPHPAWLFSSRHPSRVVAALTATMGTPTSMEDA